MNVGIIVDKIINIPEKFYKQGDVSIYSLLKETGYFELYDQINVEDIYSALKNKRDEIHNWLQWSEDKRSNSGWYFTANETGEYIVGYFPVKEGIATERYTDVFLACAHFIKKEIEVIRSS